LLAMRAIEALAPYTLHAEVIDATGSPWVSTIMVERGTLALAADPEKPNRIDPPPRIPGRVSDGRGRSTARSPLGSGRPRRRKMRC
jgi:hypothetical protein